MSQVHVILYGKLADLIERRVELDWPQVQGSVGMARAELAGLFPHAADALLLSARACIGEALVDDAHPVLAGETIEFFPPVSGG